MNDSDEPTTSSRDRIQLAATIARIVVGIAVVGVAALLLLQLLLMPNEI